MIEQVRAKYPMLEIEARERTDGLISWLFTDPARGKSVAIEFPKGFFPSLPPVVRNGKVQDFI